MDRESAEKLFEENRNLVYWFLHKRYPDYTYDEDTQQELSIELWKACQDYNESKGALSTLAAEYMRRRMFSIMRAKYASCRYAPTASMDDEDSKTSVMAEAKLSEERSCTFVYRDWDGLYNDCPQMERDILRLTAAGYSQERIAKELGVSHTTITKHKRRLQKRTREWIGGPYD